jgi:serine/threonine-protein kinase
VADSAPPGSPRGKRAQRESFAGRDLGVEAGADRSALAHGQTQDLGVAPTLQTPMPISSNSPPLHLGPEAGGANAAAILDDVGHDHVVADERAADAERLRRSVAFAAPAWLLAALLDLSASRITTVSLGWLLALRVGTAIVVLAAFRALRPQAGSSRGRLSLLSWILFVPPCLAMAVMALDYGGLSSPYGHGIILAIAIYGTSLSRPAARAWPLTATLGLVYPALMLGAAWTWRPDLAQQLHDPASRTYFIQTVIAQVLAAVLAGIASHFQWKIRRQLLTSRQRSRYVLEAKLGAGGMAEVWRATRADLGQAVALKLLHAGADQAWAERFVREVKATAELTHPHTVRVLDCGVTDDGGLYYTMELLDGESLAQLVIRKAYLPPAQVAYFGLAAARALAEAHGRGLVHRDIKPENVFITTIGGEPDFVKILDFGIAKRLMLESGLTQEGTRVGTPVFMAPEQARGQEVDARADVYALGAVLYAALVGAPPHDQAAAMSIVLGGQTLPVMPPSIKRDNVPVALEAVIMKCLAPDPRARYADGGELAEALHATGLPETWRPRREVRPGTAPQVPDQPTIELRTSRPPGEVESS